MKLFFKLPKWIQQHFYTGKGFSDLTDLEIEDLKARIKKFSHEDPDVSVVIPAWNEENNIFRAVSSLASNIIDFNVEIVVINNNSTDNTQKVLEELGIRNYLQPEQGTSHARQLGLSKARGKYHLCADSDTFYPPRWIELMVKPMQEKKDVVGVYGRYCFIPPKENSRFSMVPYEKITGLLIRVRKIKREFINVLGFNMGFITAVARSTDGFKVREVRKFDNAAGSDYYIEEAEDGAMALRLKSKGKLYLVTDSDARVFTSSRRLVAEGGLYQSFWNRFKLNLSRMTEFLFGKHKTDETAE